MTSCHHKVAATDNTASAPRTLPATFSNTQIQYRNHLSKLWKIALAYWRDDRQAATPTFAIPVHPLDAVQLGAVQQDSIIRLGHSTVLLKLDGRYILIDPVFSQRASPWQWLGPKRFHAPPISLEDLPPLAVVIISHDHYDHLDKASVIALANKVETFVVPLKVGQHLRKWGIAKAKITELNWWQQTHAASISITATPAQHFSGRGLFDKDKTLWASWVIRSAHNNVFFSGDSGYFSGFKAIGERFGPFDLTLIETGAYNELWSDIHMLPEQSLQAHIDLQGQVMMPLHNSTFDLALHNWHEPLALITQLAHARNEQVSTPQFGEVVAIAEAATHAGQAWWQEAEKPSQPALSAINN